MRHHLCDIFFPPIKPTEALLSLEFRRRCHLFSAYRLDSDGDGFTNGEVRQVQGPSLLLLVVRETR